MYDANGNMIKDKNKGITNIEYNHLNLPKRIIFDEGNEHGNHQIKYTYDATGTKLSKAVITYSGNSRSHDITNYENGFITKESKNYSYDGQLWIGNEIDLGIQFISQPEGYIEPDNQGGFDYVFQYKDHLGNIRLSYSDKNNDGQITASTEIIEENNYYPFGLKHKGYNNTTSGNVNSVASKFKYNGIELEESLGLNLYEMEWRQYDASLGRFNIVDPYAEYMYDQTPYHFSFNNPVFFSDPSGLCPNNDCDDVGDSEEGDTTKADGATWVVSEGKWARKGGDLEEVVVVSSSKKSKENTTSSKKDSNSENKDPMRSNEKEERLNYPKDMVLAPKTIYSDIATSFSVSGMATPQGKPISTTTIMRQGKIVWGDDLIWVSKDAFRYAISNEVHDIKQLPMGQRIRQTTTFQYYIPGTLEKLAFSLSSIFEGFGTSQTIELNQIKVKKVSNSKKNQLPTRNPEFFKD